MNATEGQLSGGRHVVVVSILSACSVFTRVIFSAFKDIHQKITRSSLKRTGLQNLIENFRQKRGGGGGGWAWWKGRVCLRFVMIVALIFPIEGEIFDSI